MDGWFANVRDCFGYFNAIVKANECTNRSFALTTDAALLNPANYTVWQFRRIVLKKLEKCLRTELKFITEVILEHPKNYQVWHHRSFLVDELNQRDLVSTEKQFISQILADDAKNYHAWQYRQWLVRRFDAWAGEVEFTNALIEKDIRNNSAWNHRFYVLHSTSAFASDVRIRDGECDFALKAIQLTPHNESPWNYLRGIVDKTGMKLESESPVRQGCEKLYADGCRSPHLLHFVVDYLSHDSDGDLNRIHQLLDEMSSVDPMRTNYHNYLRECLPSRSPSICNLAPCQACAS